MNESRASVAVHQWLAVAPCSGSLALALGLAAGIAAVSGTVGCACSDQVSVGSRDGAVGDGAGPDYVRTDECGNGLDEDGDGRIDDGCPCAPGERQRCFGGPLASREVGLCSDGSQTCAASGTEWGDWGDSECEGALLPAEESCDGLDRDCDGVVDEGCPCAAGDSRPCGVEHARAPCRSGEQTCVDGAWGGCEGAIGPTADVCDGIDNDCDGSPDVGCGCTPVPELCRDGRDNDCDGAVDEPACDPDWGSDAGASDACIASAEACGNRVDDDCDGTVDEGCADGCEGIACSGHGSCFATTSGAACDCDTGFHAVALTCVADDPGDPCSGVVCATGACMVSGGAPRCVCYEPFRCGARFDYGIGTCVSRWDSCAEIDCSGHGTCFASPEASDVGAQCACDPGYHAVGRFRCEPDVAWLAGADCAATPTLIASDSAIAAPHTEPQAMFAHGDSLYVALPHGMSGTGCDRISGMTAGNILRIPKRGGPAQVVDRTESHEYVSGLGFLQYGAINVVGDRLVWVRVPYSADLASTTAEIHALGLPASAGDASDVIATFDGTFPTAGGGTGLVQPTGRIAEAYDGALIFTAAYRGHPVASEGARVLRASGGAVTSMWNSSAFDVRGLGIDDGRFVWEHSNPGTGSFIHAMPVDGGDVTTSPTPTLRGFDAFEWASAGWAYVNAVGSSGSVELHRINTTDGRSETVVAADLAGAIPCGAGEVCYGTLTPPPGALHAVPEGGGTSRTIVSGRTFPPRWLAVDDRCVYWIETSPSDPDPSAWEIWSVAIR